MMSKFYGIKFIAEMKNIGRGNWFFISFCVLVIAFVICDCSCTLVGHFLFINGFPLGIIWGVIYSYVEGRKATDFIGAALAVSFIFSSGFVKWVAKTVQIYFVVSDWWLPFVTGFVFIIPLILLVYLMEKIPAPSETDINLRVTRLPMTNKERKYFLIVSNLD